MNSLTELAEREQENLSHLIDEIKKSLLNAPGGTLAIKHRKGRTEYYHCLPGNQSKSSNQIYIPKDHIEMARLLAQKNYDIKILRNLEAANAALKQFIENYPKQNPAEVYTCLNKERKELVKPLFPTDEQFIERWLAKPYQEKGFSQDDKFFYTEKGEKVRSKSEVIIANTLYHMGIPYKYECPLCLGGRIIYPDFTTLDMYVREEVYLEHFGMMDNKEYADNFLKKIELYESNGIFPGKKLVCTFESLERPLNTRILNSVIKAHYHI